MSNSFLFPIVFGWFVSCYGFMVKHQATPRLAESSLTMNYSYDNFFENNGQLNLEILLSLDFPTGTHLGLREM